MPNQTFAQAIMEAYQQEMRRDEKIFIIGIDVKASLWGTTRGLYEEFGPDRIRDAPVCEGSFTMAAIGAAMAGMRPVVQISFADFLYLAMDPIVNHAASWGYVSSGQYKIPLVVEAYSGARGHAMYSHSQSPQASFLNTPGLKMFIPSNPADAKGLMAAAIRDDGPVLFFTHRRLLAVEGAVPEGEHILPLGEASVLRSGGDVTLVSYGAMVHTCLEAADSLAAEGIGLEVIDLRTLVPFDEETVVSSIEKTSRLMVVEDARKKGGIGAEISAVVAERHIDLLDAPIVRMAALDVPIPYASTLEKEVFPDKESIISSVRGLLQRKI